LRFIVLLSGGLDSAVNLKCALDDGIVDAAITFDYGQAAARNEIRAAGECAQRLGVPHTVIKLGDYWGLLPEALRDGGRIAKRAGVEDSDPSVMLEQAWVPNRNGVFVNIAAAFAESRRSDAVVIGLNREEAEIFPDNSERFLERINQCLAVSTLTGVKALSFTTRLSKGEIVRLGLERGAPLESIYSCYQGSPDGKMCGECQSCLRLKRALELEDYQGLKPRFVR
jgi:7-cyano-7-deazaguanine synthase